MRKTMKRENIISELENNIYVLCIPSKTPGGEKKEICHISTMNTATSEI
jgi:hypothetical protein